MADDPITPKKTAEFEYLSGEGYKLGCMDVDTGHGLVHVHDAPGFITNIVEVVGRSSTIGLLNYVPGDVGGKGFGLISQLDADSARRIAASLLRLADTVDGTRSIN